MRKRTTNADVFARVADANDDAEVIENVAVSAPVAPKRTASRRKLIIVTSLLLAAVCLGASTFAGWHDYQQHRLTRASDEALRAATAYAVVLTTLDSANIDDNYRRTLDGATGEFKDAYSQGANQLRQTLIDNKASGTGIVVDAAVKSATPNKVEVLLFVDQSITNAANPSPRIDRNRIAMTMERVDGRWLASKVEIL